MFRSPSYWVDLPRSVAIIQGEAEQGVARDITELDGQHQPLVPGPPVDKVAAGGADGKMELPALPHEDCLHHERRKVGLVATGEAEDGIAHHLFIVGAGQAPL